MRQIASIGPFLDALYADQNVMRPCFDHGWNFCISFLDTDIPPEVLTHLDAAINLVSNEKVLKVAGLRLVTSRSAAEFRRIKVALWRGVAAC